ncbi:MAG: hypothetical protein LBD11_04815 [Candidatus Peribacteria bacterium]|nr:hypothetical protein [Candidatus Peribacteria bacterium]
MKKVDQLYIPIPAKQKNKNMLGILGLKVPHIIVCVVVIAIVYLWKKFEEIRTSKSAKKVHPPK